jgi:hypothetical protein
MPSAKLRLKSVPLPEHLESELPRIRTVIARDGIFVATGETLAALLQERRFEEQFRILVEMTRRELWSFIYLPDGTVQIGPIPNNEPSRSKSDRA